MAVDTELPQQGGPHTRPTLPSEGVTSPATPATGQPIAPQHPDAGPQDHGLPPGVHPMDQTAPDEWELGHEQGAQPVRKGRKPFDTKNTDAFGVFQRAASHFRIGTVVVNPNEGGTVQIVGRVPGRTQLRLWVPASIVVGGVLVTPGAGQGVLFAPTEGELQAGVGAIINIGDPPVLIESESSVHVGLIPGQAIGYVQWLELYNPPGGGIIGNT